MGPFRYAPRQPTAARGPPPPVNAAAVYAVVKLVPSVVFVTRWLSMSATGPPLRPLSVAPSQFTLAAEAKPAAAANAVVSEVGRLSVSSEPLTSTSTRSEEH